MARGQGSAEANCLPHNALFADLPPWQAGEAASNLQNGSPANLIMYGQATLPQEGLAPADPLAARRTINLLVDLDVVLFNG
jgi:hypothetical protein